MFQRIEIGIKSLKKIIKSLILLTNTTIHLLLHISVNFYDISVYTDKKVGLSMTLPIVNENLELIGGLASNFLGA